MAIATLERPSLTRRPSANSAPRRDASPKRISAARLQELEDRLLAAAIAHHPNSDHAIERLLDDIESLPHEHPQRELTPLRRHHQLERMDDLLMQAVVDSHPDRPVAIERLLGDVVGDAALDDTDEQLERLRFDMRVDNDFDGLS